MIVIKIKTWSDYKKQFLDWVKEPRQQTCIGYVSVLDSVLQMNLVEDLSELSKELHIGKDVKERIEIMMCETVHSICNQTIEVIKDKQPKI